MANVVRRDTSYGIFIESLHSRCYARIYTFIKNLHQEITCALFGDDWSLILSVFKFAVAHQFPAKFHCIEALQLNNSVSFLDSYPIGVCQLGDVLSFNSEFKVTKDVCDSCISNIVQDLCMTFQIKRSFWSYAGDVYKKDRFEDV